MTKKAATERKNLSDQPIESLMDVVGEVVAAEAVAERSEPPPVPAISA